MKFLPLLRGGAAGASYQDKVLQTAGLVGYWRLDEPAGAGYAQDVVAQAHAQRFGATLGAASLLASTDRTAASFDGTDDYFEVGNFHKFTSGSFSIEFWVKPTAANASWRRILSKAGGATKNGWDVLLLASSDSPANGCQVELANAGTSTYHTTSTGLPTDSATHMVIVVDRTANEVRLYRNGVLDVTSPSPGTVGSYDGALRFGQETGGGNYFGGVLDEVAFYSGVLSAATITDHYNAGVSTSKQASGSASVSGKAIVLATGTKAVSGTATATAASRATGSGQKGTSSTSTVTAPSRTTASGAKGGIGQAAVTARATVAATGAVGTAQASSGTALVSARAVVTSQGVTNRAGAGSATAGGLAAASGRKQGAGLASSSSRAAATASGRKGSAQSATATARGSATATGQKHASGSASASASARATAEGTTSTIISGSASASAGPRATATGQKHARGTASASARAQTTATGSPRRAGAASASASGRVVASGTSARSGAARASVSARVTATGGRRASGAASISATARVTAAGGVGIPVPELLEPLALVVDHRATTLAVTERKTRAEVPHTATTVDGP